ncbi:LysR family transcriptional regulator [Neptuniibacter pectenicola]|uniref:LysR family transcriptional regulator n=1 Tax=Neptuniibacter pectenicola TaxID=1806669 RepID=UPI0030EEB23A|tara:strand:- start:772 stop:1671 length:900 start_codon:yes stop_codon:yes gene_type:complete
MDKLETMRVFVEVAECQSFVGASRKLDLSPPTVTRSIAQLEHTLGVRLFNRTTRNIRLTDAGARFFTDAKRILDDIAQAEAAASGSYATPKGALSVTAPVLFGQKYIAPILTEYLRKNSEVEVRAAFYDRVSNILDEGLDVAIRIGHLKDSSMFATQVGSIQRILCASPEYLEKNGTPESPADLAKHEIILASTVESSTTWRFELSQKKLSVKVFPRLYCSQNGTAIEAAKQGFGITRLLSYQVGEELQAGTLRRILCDYEIDSFPVNIIHLEGRQANIKIRSFIDLAVDRLRANPFIN